MNSNRSALDTVLGVDFGNVIIDHAAIDPNDKELHEERYSTIPVMSGAFEALKELNARFKGRVYIVSKCTLWAQEKILAWLTDNDFYTKTGIDAKHVHFVRERHEKDAVCRTLGVTHFIDDRLEVLSHMVESVPHLFLFRPKPEEVEKFKQFLQKVTIIDGWNRAVSVINST